MADAFVFPIHEAEKAQFVLAAENGYELQSVLSCIGDKGQAESIKRCCASGRCYIWAVPDRRENRSTWELISANDLLLAYSSGSIIAASHVLATLDDPSLAHMLWGTNEKGAPLMCFTEKPYTGEVPLVEQMHRYIAPGFTGFTRLGPDRCSNILSDYGSFEIFVRLCLKYDFPFSFRHSE